MASIADPEILATALRDAQVEYLRLAPGAFTATLTAIDLGPVRLQVASDHAHISRGQVAADRSMLLLGLELAAGCTHMNGIRVAEHDVVHLGSGAALFARVLAPVRWAAFSFRADALQADIPDNALPAREEFLLRRRDGAHQRLAAFAREAAALAERDPMRFALPAVRKAMAEDALRASVAAITDPAESDTAFRAVQRRVALVARAEELLAARMGEALYSEDLQHLLGVPMRTLHNAFIAVHGMSVHRYLRLRRLHMARAALRAGPGSVSHVKMAALDHGFWHLGRFAHEYRGLFGELPSETIGRGHATLLSAP
ncbi:helix-turn-helix domain-containing protein [Roseomonas sp. CAU 1739]